MINIILACDQNGVIGKNGKLPWHCPADLEHFKKTTMGGVCIVGRKTWETLPKLEGRELIVVSRTMKIHDVDCNSVATLQDALNVARVGHKEKPIFIIGGAEIYRQAFAFADYAYVTEITGSYAGDTFFHPPFGDPSWKIVSSSWREVDGCAFYEMERIK